MGTNVSMCLHLHISADLGEGHGDTLGVLLQLVEDGVVAELEHKVQLALPPEHLEPGLSAFNILKNIVGKN